MIQNKPTYGPSHTSQPASMREVQRLSATLDRPDVAREIILEWLENDAKTDLPESAWKGGAFQHEAGKRSFTAIRAIEGTSRMWALRFVEPDPSATERVWTTEVAMREKGDAPALFSLRTLVRSSERKLRIQPTVPKYLLHLSEECVLQQGAARIEKDPWIIESDYDAANLAEFLIDPARKTPAFVLTVPEESPDPHEPLLDPRPLAADTLGTAKVIVLPSEFTWRLTDRFGKQLSVYRGALRVYLAGFSEHADPQGGHDLFMPHRMDTEESAAKLGSLLRWIAARESLRRLRLDQDVLPFASVLLPAMDFEGQGQEDASEADQLKAVRTNLSILREELRYAVQMQQWLTQQNKELEGRLRQTEARLRSSQPRRRPGGRYGTGRPGSGPYRPPRRGEWGSDYRPERGSDYRGEHRPDRRAEHRPDRRSEHRPDRRSEHRPDRRSEHRPDRRSEHRPDRRGEHRHDRRPDFRSKPRYDRQGPRDRWRP